MARPVSRHTDTLNLRIDAELKAALALEAHRRHLTVSDVLRQAALALVAEGSTAAAKAA